MTTQPFTSAGAVALQAELYALTDPALEVQAGLIRADFRDWIESNFHLDAAQVSYLTSIDDDYVAFIAQNLATAVENRLTVTLTTPAFIPELHISKLLETTSTLTAVYDPGGNSATGTLGFTVYYV